MAADPSICGDLQKEELIALSSIYEDNFKQISDNSYEINILGEDETWGPMTLRFMLPVDYPQSQPPLYEIFCECFKDEELEEIYQKLDEIWEEYEGECVIFMWIEKCKEILFEKQRNLNERGVFNGGGSDIADTSSSGKRPLT